MMMARMKYSNVRLGWWRRCLAFRARSLCDARIRREEVRRGEAENDEGDMMGVWKERRLEEGRKRGRSGELGN